MYCRVVLGLLACCAALAGCDLLGLGQVAAPVITPESSGDRVFIDQSSPVEIGILSETNKTAIYYTTDESEPSLTNGTLYEGPFSVDSTGTVRAVASHERRGLSEVTSADFLFYQSILLPDGNFSFMYAESGTHGTVFLDGFLISNSGRPATRRLRVAKAL